mmetsp:Transcript_57552/g.106324  ORF Transcript_57552/g.106324 Transcript_57552/m.106324 type:complete len:265 (+) Transcript_57552:76-870(+)
MQDILLAALSVLSSCNTFIAWASLGSFAWERVGLDSPLAAVERRLSTDDDDDDDDEGRIRFLRLLRLLPIVIGLVILIVELVLACVYNARVTSQRQAYTAKPPGSGEFVSPMWGCCDDCNYCMQGLFCMYQRAGDSAQAVGVSRFWRVVLVLAVLDFCATLCSIIPLGGLLGFMVFGPIRGAFMSSIRSQERGAVGHDPSCNACDFMLWWFCGCCASIQEAKEVDMETSTHVRACCCTLEAAPSSGGQTVVVVGQPVVAKEVDT